MYAIAATLNLDYSPRPESNSFSLRGLFRRRISSSLPPCVLEGVVAALLEDAVPMPCRGGADLFSDYRIARLVELARDVIGLAAGLARRIINSFLAVAAGAAQLLPLDTTTRPPATLYEHFAGSMFPPRAFLRNR